MVTAGRRRGPDIFVQIAEAYDRQGAWVRGRGHPRTSGVEINSFVREWLGQVVMGGMTQQTVRSLGFTLIFNDLFLRFLFCSTNGSS
jgi:hypothetical protein